MTIRTLGKTFLDDGVREDGGRFTTDPRISRNWPPRRTRLLGIGGTTTEQDFGRFDADIQLTLTSNGNFINQEFKRYVESLLEVKGKQYAYSDYQGMQATVVIVNFVATPTFIGDGLGILYEYELVLDVIELQRLDFGDPPPAGPPGPAVPEPHEFMFDAVTSYQFATDEVVKQVRITAIGINGQVASGFTGNAELFVTAVDSATNFTVEAIYTKDPDTGELTPAGTGYLTPSFIAGECDIWVALPAAVMGNTVPSVRAYLTAVRHTDPLLVGSSNSFLVCAAGYACAGDPTSGTECHYIVMNLADFGVPDTPSQPGGLTVASSGLAIYQGDRPDCLPPPFGSTYVRRGTSGSLLVPPNLGPGLPIFQSYRLKASLAGDVAIATGGTSP